MSAIILHFPGMGELPNRIRTLRKLADISQQKLADAICVSKPTISELETGKMQLTLDYMRRIAKVFGVAPVDVLNEEDHNLFLRQEEEELIRRYRAADDVQKEMINRVAEPRRPFDLGVAVENSSGASIAPQQSGFPKQAAA
jgi:transcriptional regulator with XRE-family HTH domain